MHDSPSSRRADPSDGRIGRRAFLGSVAAAAGFAAQETVGLGFGTYAHQMLRWEDSIELIGRTGYDGLELAVLPDWPSEPRRLSRTDRGVLRARLDDMGLQLPALLDNLRAADPVLSLADNLDRLRRAIELGRELSPRTPPVFETVLGRAPDEWDEVKNQMVDEIGAWTRAAADGQTVICFKPHVSHAVNDVARSLWLVGQIDSPYFRCTFDYSHLWLAGLGLTESLDALLPVSSYVHLKDAERADGRYRFLLPGDGETDYPELFRGMARHGYGGFATVEVSAQIHRRPDYEPIAATRTCYERMAAAMEMAGLARP